MGCDLGISIYFVLSKISKNNLISFFVTLLIMFLGKHYITARAQLVTFILFVWTMYFIEAFLDTKKKRYAIGLILIPIAIANIHLRTADRVLIKMAEFEARTFEELWC